MKTLTLLILSLLFTYSCGKTNNDELKLFPASIINGEIVQDNDYFSKAIVHDICTGSILTEKAILTAAHCTIYAFSFSDSREKIEIEKVITHKKYKLGKADHDIAILIPKKPIDLKKYKQVIIDTAPLAPQVFYPVGGSYFQESIFNNFFQSILHTIINGGFEKIAKKFVTYLEKDELKKTIGKRGLYKGTLFSSAKKTSEESSHYFLSNFSGGAYVGDSGAPVFVKKNNNYYQHGIISLGDLSYPMPTRRTEGFYHQLVGVVAVNKHLEWINSIIKKEKLGTILTDASPHPGLSKCSSIQHRINSHFIERYSSAFYKTIIQDQCSFEILDTNATEDLIKECEIICSEEEQVICDFATVSINELKSFQDSFCR